eukprot:NODE_2894_length_1319_cov_127.627090_g2747_i0.p1 GENE.NODE_2894_length_1319_cov_127.627090_g2747_i0~~NODE_2894_length_1319_cov_127.627090_g2747_i0.p1  ORF type:complete len:393 (+),score=49.07 NODE_2894_length_1319_cov_127.627090_g2747_i0:52-1179(+)
MCVPSHEVGLIFTMLSMVFWGSWSVVIPFTTKRGYRFELFYLDYTLGCMMVLILLSGILGNLAGTNAGRVSLVSILEKSPNRYSIDNARTLNGDLPGRADRVLWAIAGGAMCNVGNILLANGITLAGLAIAFPMAVGTALVCGTSITYLQSPKGDPKLLFLGVALGFVAVCFISLSHHFKEQYQATVSNELNPDMEEDPLVEKKPKPSRAKVLAVCMGAGATISLWPPLSVLAMAQVSPESPESPDLTVYCCMIWFSLGIGLSSMVLNYILMRNPLTAERPVFMSEYFGTELSNHLYGLFAATIWSLGTLANLVGGREVGFAVGLALGQSAPMVATLWGVLYFREFSGAGTKAIATLCCMFLFYGAAIASMAASS